MDSEKITVNLGMVELGKIDLLVEQGIFSNRSDFIRTAIREQLSRYDSDIKGYMKPTFADSEQDENKGVRYSYSIGVLRFSRTDFERLRENGQKLKIAIIGVLSIDSKITAELFADVVESVKVYGACTANDEVKKLISKMGAENEGKN